jgi:hypothetical protein
VASTCDIANGIVGGRLYPEPNAATVIDVIRVFHSRRDIVKDIERCKCEIWRDISEFTRFGRLGYGVVWVPHFEVGTVSEEIAASIFS